VITGCLLAGEAIRFFCDVEGTKNNLQFTGDDYKTKIKRGLQGDKNEKPEFTSTEEPGDTVVSTLAGVLASHI